MMNSGYGLHSINIPSEIPTSGQDWSNHVAGFYNSDTQLKVVLEFKDRIHKDKMIKAVRLSIDVEPVLGCYFQETDQDPIWKRFENIDDMEWCLFEECKDRETALENFFVSSLSPSTRQLQAILFHTEDTDILCLTINHSCADVSGVKGYLHILSNIYGQLCINEDYYPIPNNNTNRGMDEVFKNLGITDLRKAWNPKQETAKPTWAFPYYNEKRQMLKVTTRKILTDDFKAICSYARVREATVNDFMMTAFYRTLFNLIDPETTEPLEITITADLRRYLPKDKTGAICSNMSAKINTKLERVKAESFDSTLKRTSSMMKDIKENNPGINSAIAMELIRNMGYKNVVSFFENTSKLSIKSKKASPLLTNMGIIADYPFSMGDNLVKDAYIISPAGYAPNFIFGFSSYNSTLTMTVNYFEPATSSKDVEKFFDLLMNELSQCC